MMTKKPMNRRDFLTGASALGAASLFGFARTAAADPPPETTNVKFGRWPVSCIAPQFVAEPLLKAEGFSGLQYVEVPYGPTETAPYPGTAGPGKVDFDLESGTAIMLTVPCRRTWNLSNHRMSH